MNNSHHSINENKEYQNVIISRSLIGFFPQGKFCMHRFQHP